MKLTTLLLFLLFSLVQIAPAVKTACDNNVVSLFNPDEEKGNDKTASSSVEEIKEKKNHSLYLDLGVFPGPNANCYTRIEFSGKLPMPVVDLITPPPNLA